MIIFINGSINSGKTTIAALLKKKIPKSAHLEVDNLRALIDWVPLEESLPISLENTACIINNLTAHNINVIVSYPMNKHDYGAVFKSLKGKHDIHFFTLNPKLEVALSNRGERELTEWETDRIKFHYKEGINKPGFGVNIDNSKDTPEQTVAKIMEHLF
jgi:hypothetical protein